MNLRTLRTEPGTPLKSILDVAAPEVEQGPNSKLYNKINKITLPLALTVFRIEVEFKYSNDIYLYSLCNCVNIQRQDAC